MHGALVAQAFVVLGHKGHFGQGVQAPVTVVAGVMPLAVVIMHLLGVGTSGLAMFHAGAGTECVRALQQQWWASFCKHFFPCRGSLWWWQASFSAMVLTQPQGGSHTRCVHSGMYLAGIGYNILGLPICRLRMLGSAAVLAGGLHLHRDCLGPAAAVVLAADSDHFTFWHCNMFLYHLPFFLPQSGIKHFSKESCLLYASDR